MKKQYGVKLVVAGTRQLITVTLKAISKESVKNYIFDYYGYCYYLVISEL